MEKLDQDLSQAIAEARDADTTFDVLILCTDDCAEVISILTEAEINDFNHLEELSIVTTSVGVDVLTKIDALHSVTRIERDAEAGIDAD